MPASFVTLNISEAPGVDVGLPSVLGQITILVSEVGCEPLVIGPRVLDLGLCH